MKRILKSKKGLSLLEGLLALMLLALVATGAFSVLLSTSRKSSEPDIREEMALAVERAQQMLQVYVFPNALYPDSSAMYSDFGSYTYNISRGLCENETTDFATLGVGSHNIECLLPPICDRSNSSFIYDVSTGSSAALRPRSFDQAKVKKADGTDSPVTNTVSSDEINVSFSIKCNGYTL